MGAFLILHQISNSKNSDDFNAFLYTDQKWDFHFHKNFELIYVIKGSMECNLNGKTYTLNSGDFGLSLSYDVHSYTPKSNTLYWVCVFSESYVKTFAKLIQNKQAKGYKFRCKDEVITLLKAVIINEEKPLLLNIKACLYAICAEYLNQVELIENDYKHQQIMFDIIDFVQKNHTKKIGLSDIAEHLGYDYHYISRRFRKIFNMSFTEFLNSYRLETALNLLLETNKSITEIALESGFQSVRSFNNYFKIHYRISPSEYKKQSLS